MQNFIEVRFEFNCIIFRVIEIKSVQLFIDNNVFFKK
jgi:hypothetical protein